MLTVPLAVEVEAKVKTCPGVTTKYSPPTVLAGIIIPVPGILVEPTVADCTVVEAATVETSILAHPANEEITRICWVATANLVEYIVVLGLAPPT